MRSFQVKLTIKTDGSLQVQVINKTIITRIKMLHMHAVFTLPAQIPGAVRQRRGGRGGRVSGGGGDNVNRSGGWMQMRLKNHWYQLVVTTYDCNYIYVESVEDVCGGDITNYQSERRTRVRFDDWYFVMSQPQNQAHVGNQYIFLPNTDIFTIGRGRSNNCRADGFQRNAY